MSTVMVFNVSDTRLGQEFENLFHEHYPLVYRTAYRVTGRAEDAEDVVQTLFLRLVRSGLPSDRAAWETGGRTRRRVLRLRGQCGTKVRMRRERA